MERDSLDELIVKHLEGTISDEEHRALEAEILGHPEAAARLRALARGRLVLAEALGAPDRAEGIAREASVSASGAKGPRRVLRGHLGTYALALAAVLVAAVAWIRFVPPEAPAAPRFRGGEVLLLAEAGDPAPALEIEAGRRYLARAGELALAGSTVRLLAPSIFALELPPAAAAAGEGEAAKPVIQLEAGHVRVEVALGAPGLRLRTARGELRDIGTVFDVQLNPPMEESAMIGKVRSGSLPIFVLATVLAGQVLWTPAEGEARVLSSDEGPLKLADDYRLGRVADREGLAFVQPVGGSRWTLVDEGTPLEIGDIVKTAVRGANAAELSLADGTRLVLGPGGLVQLVEKGRVMLFSGELEAKPAAGGVLTLEGPGNASVRVDSPRIVRAREGGLDSLAEDPKWLVGFRAKGDTEALGSLLATIDGRNEPLTIGYHSVTVDIRDRIARTVVEESFINRTNVVLEGTFRFPLPQDASISGFGMWIGDELVEADIVEKERAREIYEEILREKRDPALLEWTGGSIFKARVYPIPAHGEKRIRIEYTQVLPRVGNTWRYQYPLRSEMLEKHPLRELRVKATVSSSEVLASVQCPSHPARVRKTERSAEVEFSAEEYVPRSDFELVLESAPGGPGVIVVPHRRADDGYLMVLLSTPGAGERRLVKDGDPLDLVILADTSNSMDEAKLADQRGFIAALLEALGEHDRFNLAAFDVETAWAFPSNVEASSENRARALDFLEKRGALGWTDIERAFREVFAGARPGTHVVYVGDGIPVLGDADPAALAARLRKLGGAATCHAVGVGSTRDDTVLGAIASIGSGSLHRAGGSTDAARTAAELLGEIASPGLRDIALEWKGLRAAAVYPRRLPNLPAGREQVILARYLPEGKELAGSLRVTGVLEGKPWSAEVPVVLAASEEGNAFLPRFWARLHLDRLLEEVPTPEVREQIIALSEDFQIITPYTSLLVLESDADRERFRVKKRLRMRGGEEFFAEGRERAGTDLARDQMLRARTWRTRLRERTLALYAGMGRDLLVGGGGVRKGLRGPGANFLGRSSGLGFRGGIAGNEDLLADFGVESWYFNGGEARYSLADSFGLPSLETAAKLKSGIVAIDGITNFDVDESLGDFGDTLYEGIDGADAWAGDDKNSGAVSAVVLSFTDGLAAAKPSRSNRQLRDGLEKRERGLDPFDGWNFVHYLRDSELSSLPRPLAKRVPPGFFPEPGGASRRPAPRWPAAVRALVDRLNPRPAWATRPGGLRIVVASESRDIRGRVRPGLRSLTLAGGSSWASRTESFPGAAPRIDWVRPGEQGALDAARSLGSRRRIGSEEMPEWPSPVAHIFDDLERGFRAWVASVEEVGGRAVLRLVPRGRNKTETRIVVDLERSVILEIVTSIDGKTSSSLVYGDFVEVAGRFLPGSVETRDADGKVVGLTRASYEELAPEAFASALSLVLEPLAESLVLELPLPEVDAAKRAAATGKAGLAERWALLLHSTQSSEWDRAREELAAIETLFPGKLGLDWLRFEVLRAARRNEEVRALVLSMARRLADAAAPGDYSLAAALRDGVGSIFGPEERLELLSILERVFARQDAALRPELEWKTPRRSSLEALGRMEEAQAILEACAKAYLDDTGLQGEVADRLALRGEVDAAVAHLDRIRLSAGPWTQGEEATLRDRAGEILRQARRLVDYLAYLDRWVAESPQTVTQWALDRSISALIMLDREAEADARIEAWLAGATGESPSALERNRFLAAATQALGQGADLYSNREIEKRWRRPLIDAARRFAFRVSEADLVSGIIENWRFRQLPEAAAFHAELFTRFTRGLATLPPEVLARLCRWIRSSGRGPAKGEMSWDEIGRELLDRRDGETDPQARAALVDAILSTGSREATLALRRRELAEATNEEDRAQAFSNLFDVLIGSTWSPEVEAELLGLVPRLGTGPDAQLTRLQALRRILGVARSSFEKQRLEAIPDRSRKSRRELRPLEDAARKLVSADAVAFLRKLEGSGFEAALIPFLKLERLAIEAEAKLDPARVFAETRGLLLELPPRDAKDPLDPEREILAERACLVLGALASRPEAGAELAADYLRVLDGLDAAKAARPDAKRHRYLLLVALDRGDELESLLSAWAREYGDGPANPWKIPLAYVLAERGKLAEAVAVLESVAAADELGASDYQTLAAWRLALDRKEASLDARVLARAAEGEWTLANALRQRLSLFQRRGEAPAEDIDEEVLLRFRALLRKASSPENHVGLLQEYYAATKDFRLLESLPEGVLGQSAGRIHLLLGSLGPVLALIGDEATIDRMVAGLRKLRDASPTSTDRRALRLLEFLVERRAADQAQGAGPHLEAALAALREALAAEPAPGEAVLTADFLAALGSVVEGLRGEVLGKLRSLHDGAPAAGEDRYRIGAARARSLWANSSREDAIEILEATIAERRTARPEPALWNDGGELTQLSSWLESVGDYAATEALWRRELTLAPNEARRRFAELQLFQSLEHAFGNADKVALGNVLDARAPELYRALRAEILAALERRTDENHAVALVSTLCALTRAALDRVPVSKRDFEVFAYEGLPRILDVYQYRGMQGVVQTVGETLKGESDWAALVRFLVTRAETEPRWLERRGEDFWPSHGWRFAEAREKAGALGDLETRVLAAFLRELDVDLRNRNSRHRAGYHRYYGYFWKEKLEDFQRKAVEILHEPEVSEGHLLYGCAYLHEGLGATALAADLLYPRYRQGALGTEGRRHLVRFLFELAREGECVPILEGLVAEEPLRADHHADLIRARYDAKDRSGALAALAAAELQFRKEGSIAEDVANGLAHASLAAGHWKDRPADVEFLRKAVSYWDEAIALRTQGSPNRGVGEGTLSSYYGNEAQALSLLGETARAVDAAAGAIVSWGPREDQRTQALERLVEVLRGAKDLDAYVTAFEADLTRSGLENPIVRKALGRVYLERGSFAVAARQFGVAVDAGPVDEATWRALLDALDRAGRREDATLRLWALARARGQAYALFEELGVRFEAAGDAKAAERARTTLAEVSANESEGREKLALLREKQERFAEAAEEWRQVIRVRSKEPTGYLGLARSLLRDGRKPAAEEVLRTLRQQGWPSRFDNTTETELRKLEEAARAR